MSKQFDRPINSPKYQNNSRIAQKLISGFYNGIENCLENIKDDGMKIIELGAGEGHVSELVFNIFPLSKFHVTDVYNDRLLIAKKRLGNQNNLIFKYEDILDIKAEDNSYDVVICCEVLEHIENYPLALKEINRVLKKGGHFVASVPREPLWRILNMVRLKYLSDLGNTPTHVNHWSVSSFKNLITKYGFEIKYSETPLPWTMLYSRKI